MRRYPIISIALFIIVFSCFSSQDISAQEKKKLTIGNTEITLRSPITVGPAEETTDTIYYSWNETPDKKKKKKHYGYSRNFVKVYFGFGFATEGSFNGERYIPVYFGPSMDLQTGLRFYYRPCRWYAVGTQVQYSYFSYKLRDAAKNDRIIRDIPGTPSAEYYRTDNLGTAWLNRFYIVKRLYVEIGAYGDWVVGKRYIVKTTIDNENQTMKYRNDDLFTSFQAGIQSSIGYGCFSLYAKYRLTDMYYRDMVANDPPRLNLGMMFSF